MGLNIGIEVKKQNDSYGNDGRNPKVEIAKLEDEFFEFLHNKFPLGGFGKGWVSFNERENEYDFDVRMFSYSSEFNKNYPDTDMFLAITEFIYKEFSHLEGIKLRTYWSG